MRQESDNFEVIVSPEEYYELKMDRQRLQQNERYMKQLIYNTQQQKKTMELHYQQKITQHKEKNQQIKQLSKYCLESCRKMMKLEDNLRDVCEKMDDYELRIKNYQIRIEQLDGKVKEYQKNIESYEEKLKRMEEENKIELSKIIPLEQNVTYWKKQYQKMKNRPIIMPPTQEQEIIKELQQKNAKLRQSLVTQCNFDEASFVEGVSHHNEIHHVKQEYEKLKKRYHYKSKNFKELQTQLQYAKEVTQNTMMQLNRAELELVEIHKLENNSQKTILNKIRQMMFNYREQFQKDKYKPIQIQGLIHEKKKILFDLIENEIQLFILVK